MIRVLMLVFTIIYCFHAKSLDNVIKECETVKNEVDSINGPEEMERYYKNEIKKLKSEIERLQNSSNTIEKSTTITNFHCTQDMSAVFDEKFRSACTADQSNNILQKVDNIYAKLSTDTQSSEAQSSNLQQKVDAIYAKLSTDLQSNNILDKVVANLLEKVVAIDTKLSNNDFDKIKRLKRTRGKYLGCYEDEVLNRGLKGYVRNSRSNTVVSCISICRNGNFVYAGLQNSTLCFCGNTMPAVAGNLEKSDRQCDTYCSGDDLQRSKCGSENDLPKCGSEWKTSVYETGIEQYLLDEEWRQLTESYITSSPDAHFVLWTDLRAQLNELIYGSNLFLYRPSTGTVSILKRNGVTFLSTYSSTKGIGGYDMMSTADQGFAFDFDHSGKLNYIVLYRPGTGTIWILKKKNENFVPVFAQGDPGNGIGGYDLKSSYDRGFAFDFDHSGKMDYIVMYRPGTGTMWILKHTRDDRGAENFTPVYAQGDPGYGIGGYNLNSPYDRSFSFDYDHSGKMDHIVLYRPGTGTIWILKNQNGNFSPVYAQGDPGNGIGGYDLKSPYDRSFAFDYDHSGKMDHIVLYRPGTGTIWILKNQNGNFSPVYAQGDPGIGIGGYDLRSVADYAFAFDYCGNGKKDNIVLTRPGTGTIWILRNLNGNFSTVYAEGDPGNGIGGYDLKSNLDRMFAFDD